jgi:hypothetical protein
MRSSKNGRENSTPTYLAVCRFNGVERIAPSARMGASSDRWTYRWRGIHPSTIAYAITIQILGEYRSFVEGSTHQIIVTSTDAQGISPEKLLYQFQVNLLLFCEPEQLEQVAERLTCALVLYFLRQRDPGSIPGLVRQLPTQGVSPWEQVVTSTLSGIEKQLKA